MERKGIVRAPINTLLLSEGVRAFYEARPLMKGKCGTHLMQNLLAAAHRVLGHLSIVNSSSCRPKKSCQLA